MGQLLDATRSFFESDGWAVASGEADDVLRIAYAGRNGSWGCLIVAREEARQLIFYSICPVEVPEQARASVSAYLGRVNWGMPVGNFELDFLTGEVRYRTSVAFEDLTLTPALLRPLAHANVFTMGQYLEDISEVAAGTLPPDTPDVLRAMRALRRD